MINRKFIVKLAYTLGLSFNATIIMMYIFSWTGSKLFSLPAFLDTILQAFLLNAVSPIMIVVFGTVAQGIFRSLKQSGRATFIIRSVLCVIGGSVGLWLTAKIIPDTIHATTIWDGLIFSFFQYTLLTANLLASPSKMR